MRRIVVGVDGTDAGRVALDWAAAAVGADGHIHAIVAVDPTAEFIVDVITGDPMAYLKTLYDDLESRWTKDARGRVAELTADLVERSAPDALTAAAAEFNADAIVVGSHVTHLGVPKRIGATTRHLLRKLVVPLIVVPAGAEAGLGDSGPNGGRIMVGVGHGDATEAAVRWASALADDRELRVTLVRATGDGPVFQADGLLDLISWELHAERRTESSATDLIRLAEEVQELTDHDLTIDIASVPGLAAVRLADASQIASLLVIGQHRSRITLGRHTAQPLRHLLTHARCPIAVVPEWAGSEPLDV